MSYTLSSLTKKLIMSLAGLFLMVFLLVHLTINLFMLLPDQGELFKAAVHFMTTNPIIKIFEVVLFSGFILHMFVGLILFIKNFSSRPVRYYKSNKSETSFFSKYMIYTGAIVFIFLVIHFMNFYFVKLGWVSPPEGIGVHDFYEMAILLFTNKMYSLIYIVLIALLGFHLNHALQSGIQTLGFNHTRYTVCVKRFSTIYAIFVTLGFCAIPIYFLFIH
ncbi:MAG: succinate dehydrogenase cytochrome b subunit [Bacteroidota bacterium]